MQGAPQPQSAGLCLGREGRRSRARGPGAPSDTQLGAPPKHSLQQGSWEPFWVGSGSVEPICTGGMFPNTPPGQPLLALGLRFRALVLRAVMSDLFHRANAKPQSPYPGSGLTFRDHIEYPNTLKNTLWNSSSNLFSKICFYVCSSVSWGQSECGSQGMADCSYQRRKMCGRME